MVGWQDREGTQLGPSPPQARFQYDITCNTYAFHPQASTRTLLDVRLGGSLNQQAKKTPPPKPRRTFTRKVEYDSDWLVRERAKPPYSAPVYQTQASVGWKGRMDALTLLEKKPFGANIENKWVKPKWEG